MEGELTALEFMVYVRLRNKAVRRQLRLRTRDEDYPEYDDKLVIEQKILRNYARSVRMPLRLN